MLIKEKITQAIGILNEFNIDCWITFTRESAINGDPTLPFLVPADLTWHSALIITKEGDTWAIVGQYDKKMVEDTGAYKTIVGYVEGIKKPLQEYLSTLNPVSIAVNYSKDSEVADGLTHGMYLTLLEILSEINFQNRVVSAEKIISALRQRKTKSELQHMKEAIRQTENIFHLVVKYIKSGMTEKQIAQFMRNEVKKAGLELAWDPHVCPAVFSGPDTAGAHYNPTKRKVKSGHILNMDFGVKVNHYCSDLQRTLYILKPGEKKAPSEVQKGFDTIVESIERSRCAMRPGVRGIEIDAIARHVLKGNGYEEFPHALGHQVGRHAHDGTALLGPSWEKYAQKPYHSLEEGMVFTLEPRLTVQGYGVATIENMVVVTATGTEYLSTPQRKLILIKSAKRKKNSKQHPR
jgi:Xaa-Pro aminopeptidase